MISSPSDCAAKTPQAASTALATGHYENFPVASMLCPARLRPAVLAIYAFARTADDIADEGDASAADRLEALAIYKQQLDATLQGQPPASAPWPALHAAIAQFNLPGQPLRDLLSAFTQDICTTRYASFEHLLDYCRRSASPVGRLMLHLYGVSYPNADTKATTQSDAICTALQLINFWQDIGVDVLKNLPEGRIYLPQDTLAAHGVGEMQLLRRRFDANCRAAVASECERARQLMLRGAPLVHRVPGRMGWELRLVVQGGLRILDKIERLNYDTLNFRPVLGKFDYAVMLWRAIIMRA